jgi:hypothetical protein
MAVASVLNELPEAPGLELTRVISYGPQQRTEMQAVVVKSRVTCSPILAHPVTEQHQDLRVFDGFLGGRNQQ